MSRSNNTEVTNPAEYTFKWDGTKGGFKFWDGEKEQKINLPFSFLILDTLACVGGFDKDNKSGYWSNEVRSVKDELIVRNSKGQVGKGFWADLKGQITGIKFCQSIYIAFKIDEEWKIGRLKLVGASLGAWFDFRGNHNIYDVSVICTGFTNEKSGTTEYTVPTFEAGDVTEEDNATAHKLDEKVQEYLNQVLGSKKAVEAPTEEEFIGEEDPDLPF